ncbi:glucokinase [Apophysomyces ossiformis]|uniref:Phosphotransferase n=1 Tax=Apophysomyces ossiformis TaxID=679940 RepID=A0A8H7BTU6_9FUNG|nr:glucokinase [Apophysomyces ossiformis]
METDTLFKQLENDFLLPTEKLKPIFNGFMNEYKVGLRTPSKGLATMIPSFVTKLPNGNERGTFLSLDLGGTNLRISAVELKGNGQVEVLELKRCPSIELKTGKGSVFFDWIADAVEELVTQKAKHLFTADQVTGKETLSLGVCWSFPVDQTSVARGTILRMGKGFTLEDTEGHDLADMFHEAFARKGLNVRVNAIMNDTVGTLVAHAYTNPRARIGLIFATGINGAYPEDVAAIEKLDPSLRRSYPEGTKMLINTEIDIFGNDSYLPLTKYDLILDNSHSQPKFQLYEKMMSGAYLGELTRLIALDFVKAGVLFEGVVPEGMEEPWSFPTKYMGMLERDATVNHETSLEILSNYHFANAPTLQDVAIMTRICRIVATRSASLAAVAIASMIEQQDLHRKSKNDIVVGINGSTYELYPFMEERVHRALREWFGLEISDRIRLEIARDGGSIGGALIAMLCRS